MSGRDDERLIYFESERKRPDPEAGLGYHERVFLGRLSGTPDIGISVPVSDSPSARLHDMKSTLRPY
jgi:hypothetical protein